jgi:hypothetical protein
VPTVAPTNRWPDPDYESGGRKFESFRARQSDQALTETAPFETTKLKRFFKRFSPNE